MNKYQCTEYGCENVMSAPEYEAGDGICRDHRRNEHNTYLRGLERFTQWASPQRQSAGKLSQASEPM
jgi:hypothetical protein